MFTARGDEWLTFRKSYISATEASALLGLNSYMSANQLLQSKRGVGLDKLDNQHLRDGLMMEPAIFTGLSLLGWDIQAVAPEGKVLVYVNEETRVSATPDNFRWDKRALIEAKKTTVANFYKNWVGDLPPLRYLTQTQMQMHVTGFKTAYLVCTCLVDNLPLSVYKVDYSKDFMNMVEDEVWKFFKAMDEGVSKIMVRATEREKSAALLKSTYKFEGVYRHGGLSSDYEFMQEE